VHDGVGLNMARPIPATWALVSLLVLVHLGTAWYLTAHGEGSLVEAVAFPRSPRGRGLVGGQVASLVGREPWRLATSVLLHTDGLHLLVNAGSLWGMGRMLEPWVGGARVLGWFAAGGLAGSLLSLAMGLPRSDGASGAVFALLGAGVVLGLRHRAALRPEDRTLYGPVLAVLLVANLVLSFVLPFIDASSHIGGLLAGLVAGLLPWHRLEAMAWGAVALLFALAVAYPLFA
jgi:membrane associated rhomboid family serine protease